MLSVIDKEENDRSYLKLAQIHTALIKREHEPRRRMIIRNILKKQGDVNYIIPKTDYLINFKSRLIGCSAIHLAFNTDNFDTFSDMIDRDAEPTIKYNDTSVIHRVIEDNFEKNELNKLAIRFKRYSTEYTTQDINSFIVMKNTIDEKRIDWRLWGKLDNQFVDSILLSQTKNNNGTNPRSDNGISHFHAACMTNNYQAVELFLKLGTNVNESVNVDSPYYSGYTPIDFAVRCSALETIEKLLKYNVKVNSKDSRGITPLQVLIDQNIKIIEWINAKDTLPYERSALDYVNNEKIINLLIDSGNDVDMFKLYAACTLKCTDRLVNFLKTISNVNERVDIESPIWPGYTALHVAAYFNMETVKLLLQSGAIVDVKDENGTTPFDILISRASIKDIHFVLSTNDEWSDIILSDGKTRLLDLISRMENSKDFDDFLNGMDVNAFVPIDSSLWPGYTILHLAVTFSETAKRAKFLSSFIDCSEVSCNEQFEKCRREQEDAHLEKIKICLRRNVNVSIQDARGWTPIHLAFRQRKINVVKLLFSRVNGYEEATDRITSTTFVKNLLERLKNVKDIVDQDNLSLLHIACAASCKNIVKKLISRKNIDTTIASTFKWDADFYNCTSQDIFDIIGSTPLHIAISVEDLGIIKLLVRKGANVNVKDANGLDVAHRYTSLKNNWIIGNEIFHWFDPHDQLLWFHDFPELQRYRDAIRNYESIGKQLVSLSKDGVDSNFSIHRRWKITLECTNKCETKETNREDLQFIVELPSQIETVKTRLQDEFGWTVLHVACTLFDVELIKESLKSGVDVNARTHQNSPFYPNCSAMYILMMSFEGSERSRRSNKNYESMLKMLLDNGADVTPTNVNHSRFLTSHLLNNMIYAELLLSHMNIFNLNPINDKGFTLFHLACLEKIYDVMENFLKGGIDVNQPVDLFSFDPDSYPYTGKFAGCTPLHLVSKELKLPTNSKRQSEIFEMLLAYGANVHVEDAFGNTPLHIATATGVADYIYLVRNGANVHAKNVNGKTVLETLLESNRIIDKQEIQVFQDRGCRLNTFNPINQVGYMALLICCKMELEKSLRIAMSCPSASDVDYMGRTSLHNIVSYVNFPDERTIDVIEYVLRHDVDIDHQDRLGRTALHLAAQFRNATAIKGLLSHGADINIVDVNGQTAFAYVLNPETCMVDRILKFNHFKNKSFACNVFAQYVYNMQLYGLYANDTNKQAQTRSIDDCHVKISEISDSFERIRNEQIGTTSYKLDDFMSDTGAIVNYPQMSPIEREEIDRFFTTVITHDNDDNRFCEWSFLCKLQYKKALARSKLVKDAANVFLNFSLPYVCFDIVQRFLSNTDLKNLIASTR